MFRLSILFIVIFPMNAYSLECLNTNNSYDIETHWKIRKDIFVGRVISGNYDPENESGKRYQYKLEVEKSFKGSKEGLIDFVGYGISYGLTLGDSFIFFLADDEPELCILVLPFELDWEDRYDIQESAYVRKVLNLEKGQP